MILNGWLLDLYEDPQSGVCLWLLDDDGRRLRLSQPFPVTFYAAGPPAQLDALTAWLACSPDPPRVRRELRRDLFLPDRLPVAAVCCSRPALAGPLFRRTAQKFPGLTYYDADVQVALRHAALFGTFPLARCRLDISQPARVETLEVLDSPWDLDPEMPPLRVLEMRALPNRPGAPPQQLILRWQGVEKRLSFQAPRPLLAALRSVLQQADPDLILSCGGDTWLLPHLLELSASLHIPLPFNRDPCMEVAWRREHSYFSYGQIIFRGQQAFLFGRWHIDAENAMLWGGFNLEEVMETARVTALPVQTAARVSPGTGISSMQITTALRSGVLVPWRKQQAERFKSGMDLLAADQGGLVYQPLPGLHRLVGAVDFISMYPGVMVHANISPEIPPPRGLEPSSLEPGLVPRTLAPLLEKRIALKLRLAQTPQWHPRRARDAARITAHKWLLVTCFGYLGYKNARFGRIEAHEAVTAGGREALLRAKEAAEDQGFEVLHMYVDGLWLKQAGFEQPQDYQPLLDEIQRRTGLPVALDGIYRWVAFLPSRIDRRVTVANRYFGVFQDGSLKVRGLEARRRDTPAWIAAVQMKMLETLAQAPDAESLPAWLPAARRVLNAALQDLHARRVPLADLVVGQKLSREVDAYHNPSPAARAALQLREAGIVLKPGQRVRFLFTIGSPGVCAWDLPEAPQPACLDVPRYRTLLLRAAQSVLECLESPSTPPYGIFP